MFILIQHGEEADWIAKAISGAFKCRITFKQKFLDRLIRSMPWPIFIDLLRELHEAKLTIVMVLKYEEMKRFDKLPGKQLSIFPFGGAKRGDLDISINVGRDKKKWRDLVVEEALVSLREKKIVSGPGVH